VHTFPYREVGDPPTARPIIDVEVCFAPNSWRTTALIDTGSPITVFDYGTAEALLVRLGNAGARTGQVALMGALRQIQFEVVDLSLIDDPAISWTAEVAFIRDKNFVMPFQGLLGTAGFLDKYAVTFNKYYENFSLQAPDEAPGADGYGR
jgi:hypothetical protein